VRVIVGVTLGVPAKLVAMAACPVSTTTVGKYSGGKGVGPDSVLRGTHADTSPRRDASKKVCKRVLCFISKTPHYIPLDGFVLERLIIVL
jgi:hypothetical protein